MYAKVRITAGLNNQENPRRMKNTLNKRKIRISTGSKSRESTMGCKAETLNWFV